MIAPMSFPNLAQFGLLISEKKAEVFLAVHVVVYRDNKLKYSNPILDYGRWARC